MVNYPNTVGKILTFEGYVSGVEMDRTRDPGTEEELCSAEEKATSIISC